MRKTLISASAVVLVTALLALAASYGQALGPLFGEVRELAKFFLLTAYNPTLRRVTVWSPQVVTSVIWDYRGLDTLFETAVFYMAIIGSVAIYRGIKEVIKPPPGLRGEGLSRIVKTVTKVLIPVNIAVASSIALHGHLTPGGGFQAGALMAVAPIVIIVVFSRYMPTSKGLTKDVALTLRSVGLIGLALVALVPVIYRLLTMQPAFVMQNQPKFWSDFSFPPYLGPFLISGSLIWYNVFEYLAVAFGFTIVFLLLSIDEDTFRESLRGEEIGH